MDMHEKPVRRQRRALEWTKNILIVVLVLSALYLGVRSGIVHELSGGTADNWISPLVSFFLNRGDSDPVQTPGSEHPAMAAQVVRLAIHNGTERFAAQYDTALSDKLFDATGSLLGEGLATAAAPVEVSELTWRRALQSPGIYFDFLAALPLDALYAWLGEGDSNPHLQGAARHILLAADRKDTATLYYRDEASGLYYSCPTSVAYPEHLEDALSGYGSNGALFAFEYGAAHDYANLDPYVILLPTPPQPNVYRISVPQFEIGSAALQQLQEALSFTPQNSAAAYSIQGGGLTIRDGRETLTIDSDGTVIYHAPDQDASRYAVSESGGPFSNTQLIELARSLAEAADLQADSARLSLQQMVHAADGTVTLQFQYLLDGAAVHLPGNTPAAEFIVRHGQITDYTIRFRTYEESGEHTLLLGERQATAAMAPLGQSGQELILCYEENGSTATACWTVQ